MLEEVEASATTVQCRQTNQKRKKRGQFHYSTPKQLSRSRMRRSKVVPSFKVEQGNISRTLDFQSTELEVSAQRSSCISPILKEEPEEMARNDSGCHMERSNQVSPEIYAFKYYEYLLVLWKTSETSLGNNFEIL
jgi:hypothetical protein